MLRMKTYRAFVALVSALAGLALACGGATGAAVAPSTEPPAAVTITTTSWPETNEFGVRYCQYNPAAPQPEPTVLSGPSSPPTPYPTATLSGGVPVDPQGKANQLDVFNGLWNAVNDHYVDPGFHGLDWAAAGARYQSRIEGGLSEADFYLVLQQMMASSGMTIRTFRRPPKWKRKHDLSRARSIS